MSLTQKVSNDGFEFQIDGTTKASLKTNSTATFLSISGESGSDLALKNVKDPVDAKDAVNKRTFDSKVLTSASFSANQLTLALSDSTQFQTSISSSEIRDLDGDTKVSVNTGIPDTDEINFTCASQSIATFSVSKSSFSNELETKTISISNAGNSNSFKFVCSNSQSQMNMTLPEALPTSSGHVLKVNSVSGSNISTIWSPESSSSLALEDLSNVSSTTPSSGEILTWDGSSSQWIAGNSAAIPPASSTVRGGVKVPASSGLTIDNTDEISFEFNTHLIPTSNASFDLGNAENKIRHLFLSDTSLYIGNTAIRGSGGDYALVLPDTPGQQDQLLSTNGNGVLFWTDASPGALAELTDVDVASVSDSQILKYVASEAKWKNFDVQPDVRLASGNLNNNSLELTLSNSSIVSVDVTDLAEHELAELTDVDISSASASHILKYDGTSWKNELQPISFGSSVLTDAATSSGATSTAIGLGALSAGSVSVGIGANCKAQGANSIAVGYQADASAADSIAIGNDTESASEAVAIGSEARASVGSVVLGKKAFSNNARAIVLNATGNTLQSGDDDALYVKPIRNQAGPSTLFYDSSSGEITFHTNSSDNVNLASASLDASSKVLTLTLTDSSSVSVDLSSLMDDTATSSGSVSGTNLVLTKNDGSTVSIDISSLINELDGIESLNNVAVSSAGAGEVLAYDASTQKWENKTTFMRVLSTSQREALQTEDGMIVYDSDLSVPFVYSVDQWKKFETTSMDENIVLPTDTSEVVEDVGSAVSLQITAGPGSGIVRLFSASGLPSGLSISSTGLITGSAQTDGSSTVTFTLSNTNDTKTFTRAFTIHKSPNTTKIVTVAAGTNHFGSGNKFYVDGVVANSESATTYSAGTVYRFDLSDASLSGHTFSLSSSMNGGPAHTTDVIVEDSPAFLQFEPAVDTALFIYCSAHAGMGEGKYATPSGYDAPTFGGMSSSTTLGNESVISLSSNIDETERYFIPSGNFSQNFRFGFLKSEYFLDAGGLPPAAGDILWEAQVAGSSLIFVHDSGTSSQAIGSSTGIAIDYSADQIAVRGSTSAAASATSELTDFDAFNFVKTVSFSGTQKLYFWDSAGDFVVPSNVGGPAVFPVDDGPIGLPADSSDIVADVGSSVSIQITESSGLVRLYAATGLPAGLSINQTSGLILGSPTSSGSSTATITLSNNNNSESYTRAFRVYKSPDSTQIVTVAAGVNNYGTGNKFYLDGVVVDGETATSFAAGQVYRFDTSDASTSGHPLKFSANPNAGPAHTADILTESSSPSFIQFEPSSNVDLYIYCGNHAGMGDGKYATPSGFDNPAYGGLNSSTTLGPDSVITLTALTEEAKRIFVPMGNFSQPFKLGFLTSSYFANPNGQAPSSSDILWEAEVGASADLNFVHDSGGTIETMGTSVSLAIDYETDGSDRKITLRGTTDATATATSYFNVFDSFAHSKTVSFSGPQKLAFWNSTGSFIIPTNLGGPEVYPTANFDIEIAVTVAAGTNSLGQGLKYLFDGVVAGDTLDLQSSKLYRFTMSDASVAGHPLRLSSTINGTHAGGSEVAGIVVSGTPGVDGYIEYFTPESPSVHAYCVNHADMGTGSFSSPAGYDEALYAGLNSLTTLGKHSVVSISAGAEHGDRIYISASSLPSQSCSVGFLSSSYSGASAVSGGDIEFEMSWDGSSLSLTSDAGAQTITLGTQVVAIDYLSDKILIKVDPDHTAERLFWATTHTKTVSLSGPKKLSFWNSTAGDFELPAAPAVAAAPVWSVPAITTEHKEWLEFDGSSSFLRQKRLLTRNWPADDHDGRPWVMSAYFRAYAPDTSPGMIVSKGVDSGPSHYLAYDSSGKVVFRKGSSATDYIQLESPSGTITMGEWTSILIAFDGVAFGSLSSYRMFAFDLSDPSFMISDLTDQCTQQSSGSVQDSQNTTHKGVIGGLDYRNSTNTFKGDIAYVCVSSRKAAFDFSTSDDDYYEIARIALDPVRHIDEDLTGQTVRISNSDSTTSYASGDRTLGESVCMWRMGSTLSDVYSNIFSYISGKHRSSRMRMVGMASNSFKSGSNPLTSVTAPPTPGVSTTISYQTSF